MKTRITAVLVGLFCCIALVLYNQWDRFQTPPDAPSTGQHAAAEPAHAGETPTEPQRHVDTAPALERSRPDRTGGLLVRVVDKELEPVAGAVLELHGDDGLQLPPTDARGESRAPRLPSGDLWILAKADGRSGRSSWRWRSELAREVVVHVYPDRTVAVQVRHPDGAPAAGQEVHVVQADEESFLSSSNRAETSADGSAVVQVPGYHYVARRDAVAIVRVDGVVHRSQPFSWPDAGAAAATVQIPAAAPTPATAQLTVRVVDASGAPSRAEGRLQWSDFGPIADMGLSSGGPEAEIQGDVGHLAIPPGSHGYIELVEPGRYPVHVQVDLADGILEHTTTITRGELRPRLEVTLVEDGKPVADRAYLTYLSNSHAYPGVQTEIRTDARGTFVLTLDDGKAGKLELARARDPHVLHWPPLDQLRRPYFSGVPGPPAHVIRMIAFPAIANGATHRLPPVEIQTVRDLVQGRVVDENGDGVAGARVLVGCEVTPDPEALKRHHVLTDDGGTFVIRGSQLPNRAALYARAPLRFGDAVPVAAGARGVVLTLRGTGTLEVPPCASPHLASEERIQKHQRIGLMLRLTRATEAWPTTSNAFFRKRSWHDYKSGRRRWAAIAWSGARPTRFKDLVPGTYRLTGFVGRNRVLDHGPIVIHAGEVTRLDQLAGRALGADVHSTTVRVRNGAGQPVSARVRFHPKGWAGPHGTNAQTDEQGITRFVLPRNLVCDVEVVAKGYAPKTLRDATFPLEVTMSGGTSLAFAVTGLDAVRPHVRAVLVSVTNAEEAPASPLQDIGGQPHLRHPMATLDERGRATLPNLQAGRYKLWLCTVRKVYEKGPPYHFVPIGEHTVTDEEARTVDVPFDVLSNDADRLRGR